MAINLKLSIETNVNGYQVQKKFVNDFLKISKTCQYLSFVLFCYFYRINPFFYENFKNMSLSIGEGF